jgi:leader peptidase (prepilin peptidase)/N-methyltransferase
MLDATTIPVRPARPRVSRVVVNSGVSVLLALVAVLALGGQAATLPALLPALALAVVAPELVRIDVAEQRLPNRLVLPTLGLGVVAFAAGWVVSGAPSVVPAVAAVAVGGGFVVLALFGGIGMGDAKLAAALGLASPTVGIALLSPLLAFTIGGVAAVVVMVRRGRHARLAFGPFLLAGYFGALAVVAAARVLG